MKSLGPHAYTNEDHPERKPTHIATAISEALSQVGAISKPPAGAKMPDNPPEKWPKSAPHKSNSQTSASTPKANSSEHPEGNDITKQFDTPVQRSPTNTPPARSPGRPRSNRIEFFATDTFLRQNPKFIKFKRELGVTEEKAWTILTSMFCYVSQNKALTPKIDDPELFAEFCYFDDPPNLIRALIQAEFMQKDGTIINWFQNQPFAAKKASDHKNYEKQKKQAPD